MCENFKCLYNVKEKFALFDKIPNNDGPIKFFGTRQQVCLDRRTFSRNWGTTFEIQNFFVKNIFKIHEFYFESANIFIKLKYFKEIPKYCFEYFEKISWKFFVDTNYIFYHEFFWKR